MQSDTAGKQEETAQEQVERRTFLGYVVAAVGAFITTVVGVPLVGSLILPGLREHQPNWVSAGPASDFPIGQPKAATVTVTTKDGWIEQKEAKGIWVVKHTENDFTVFNGRCVHLGCAYSWQSSLNEFVCPCHGGRYSITGKVLGGPPPRPLDTLSWKLGQGNLVVQYEDFRLGIPQKEEA